MMIVNNSGLNPNSPIVNNMVGGGMYNGMMVQPNPIGNILDIGGAGYNGQPQLNNMGSYYNPYNMNYYNPYLVQQQQQRLEAIRHEEERQQADIWKKLSRKVNEVTHAVDDIEEHVKKYDPDYMKDEDEFEEKVINVKICKGDEIIKEVTNSIDEVSPQMRKAKTYKLLSIHINGIDASTLAIPRIQAFNEEYERSKEEFPDSMNLSEYLDKAGKLLMETRIRESRNRQKDISKLYNKDQYNELVKLHANSSDYFSTVFSNNRPNIGNINIDDMEVKLPTNLNDEYHRRKRAFLDSIYK